MPHDFLWVVTCACHVRVSRDNFQRVTKFPWEMWFAVCSHRDVYYFMSDVNWPLIQHSQVQIIDLSHFPFDYYSTLNFKGSNSRRIQLLRAVVDIRCIPLFARVYQGRSGSGTPSKVCSLILVCWSTAISKTGFTKNSG